MIADVPAEQIRDALDRVAWEILAEAEAFAPPVDAFAVAERLGVVIARDHTPHTRARFVRLGGAAAGGQPTILFADDPRPERRHWAVAHEIGEAFAGRVFAELGIDLSVDLTEGPGVRESVANRLAGCLLLPFDWFFCDGFACNWDLLELKSRYPTASHEMVARRMLEMSPPVIITLWDQGKQAWRRSNLSRTPPLTPPERDARQAAFDLGQPTQCDPAELPEGVADVRAWPIHEPNWKREIIRTELEESW